MDPTIQINKPARQLSERDLFFLRSMLRTNAQWVITTHNGHVTGIQPVGKTLHAESVPMWWIRYAEANDLELNL